MPDTGRAASTPAQNGGTQHSSAVQSFCARSSTGTGTYLVAVPVAIAGCVPCDAAARREPSRRLSSIFRKSLDPQWAKFIYRCNGSYRLSSALRFSKYTRLVPRVVGTFGGHQGHSESRCRPRRPMAWLRPRPPPLWGDAITQTALGLACWSYLRDIQRRRPPSRPTSITFSMSATKSLSRPAVKVFKILRTPESTRRVPVTLGVHVRV